MSDIRTHHIGRSTIQGPAEDMPGITLHNTSTGERVSVPADALDRFADNRDPRDWTIVSGGDVTLTKGEAELLQGYLAMIDRKGETGHAATCAALARAGLSLLASKGV